jgi:YD repeat-containing protein
MDALLIKTLKFVSCALLFYLSGSVQSAVLQDTGNGIHFLYIDSALNYTDAQNQCIEFSNNYAGGSLYCSSSASGSEGGVMFTAGSALISSQPAIFYMGNFYVNKCKSPLVFNVSTANCGNDEEKGTPLLESCLGNPVSLANGNNFQTETDYIYTNYQDLELTRFYNSFDGLWRHNFSSFIRLAVGKISLTHNNGRESFFTITDAGAIQPYPNETGLLVKTSNGWSYFTAENYRSDYDSSGRLIAYTNPQGLEQKITYLNEKITVIDGIGNSISFTEDKQHQPLSLISKDTSIIYSYNSNNRLTKISRTQNTQIKQRQFLYEDTRNSNLLTGIIDELGVRFATWSYDADGRAITSQHGTGTDLIKIQYIDENSRVVTNPLGKTVNYTYKKVGGIRRVAKIEGQPSPNCPASDSNYTYDDQGRLLSKTDYKGYVTTYTYNDRGLETSRTEASGTSQARTITTEWDPARFLRTKVVEPTRTTVYTYDAQGRPLSQQVSAR